MKLIIQIPCYNEEETLPVTLADLPREVPGFERVEWMVIDDGSRDDTVEIAQAHGVDHIISHHHNMGLARAFMTGLDACVRLGADVIVNTDGDNQYKGEFIPDLVKPIIDQRAEIVIGARPIEDIEHFSPAKKLLQKLGSWVVRVASNSDIPDAPSGFRAISREAAKQINVFNNYTYTLEMIIQAGQKNIPMTWVPIEINPVLRPTRLIKSIPSYIKRSALTITRIFVVYKPFRFFGLIGLLIFAIGFMVGCRFLYYYSIGDGDGHVQSLIFASIMLGMGFQTMMVAFVADLLSVNRKLMEELQYRMRDNKITDEKPAEP
ncbi:MAG: glycosyltransferase family 2 protein [Desulfobacterales bacterium]|nr:glycosyltransferase family 2 protein [Desulfobacterales bacterium]